MGSDDALMEIIVGTYEKDIIGHILEMYDEKFAVKATFVTKAHLQSVKCISSSNKYLASGSIDETIQLYNMKNRREIGALIHHNGTITSLNFYDSFLISSSEDSTICIWSTNSWQCLKTLKGHKKAVTSVSLHPSGKMALSASKDKYLRTWNLVNGRSAYAINIQKVADNVCWSPDGSHFLVACNNTIDVYSVEEAARKMIIDFEAKICSFTFINADILAVGGENESIQFYSLRSGNLYHTIKAHTTRVKALKCVSAVDEIFLISGSSDGCIQVWHVNDAADNFKLRKIANVDIGNRITCMTVIVK